MPVEDKTQHPMSELDILLNTWEVIDSMVVSLDRIGSCEALNGVEQGKKALDEYFSSELLRKLARLRRILVERMSELDSNIDTRLEGFAENEERYWPGILKQS